MNSEMFTKWVSENIIPNLPEPSLIIMDNAPYHSTLVEKQPCSSWQKTSIADWLNKNNIMFEPHMFKTELLQLAKQNQKEKRYVVDELLRSHGHDLLRLPPYHCEMNAIELIWGEAKKYYNKNIGRDGYGDEQVLNMWNEALSKCDSNIWKNCCQHTENLTKKWYEREVQAENIDPLIICINEDSSDSSAEESD